MRTILRLAVLAVVAAGFAGCASEPMELAQAPLPHKQARVTVEEGPANPLECVPYAREHSDIKIFGDANTWWVKADGKYPRGSAPETGAVMVLHNYSANNHGHVAVVKTIVSPREIRIDHANWLNDGSIYVNDPVMDVSANNDWSQVKIYNIKSGGWGTKIYPVQGFIGSHQENGEDLDEENRPGTILVASNSAAAAPADSMALLIDETP